jgi:hypothetical protein
MSLRRDRDFLFEHNLIPNNAVGAEIGVWKGEFSSEILRKTNPKKLILIDPWKYRNERAYLKRWYGGDGMSQVKMDNIYKDVVGWHGDKPNVQIIRGTVNDLSEMVDWIYIDGDHSEEPCFHDLMTSFQFVKSMLIVDDYEWEGVQNAVRRFHAEHREAIYEIKVYPNTNQCIIWKA